MCLLGAGELLAEERRLLLAIEVELRKMQTLEREGLNASIELEQVRRRSPPDAFRCLPTSFSFLLIPSDSFRRLPTPSSIQARREHEAASLISFDLRRSPPISTDLRRSRMISQARREHEAARRAADEIVSEAASRGGAASVRSTQRAASLTARAEARAAEILHAAELEATRILERGDRMLEQPQLS